MCAAFRQTVSYYFYFSCGFVTICKKRERKVAMENKTISENRQLRYLCVLFWNVEVIILRKSIESLSESLILKQKPCQII